MQKNFPEALISIELGLQTIHEKSITYIRRGFENSEYIDAVERLKKAIPTIHIVTHVIFGLPNETKEDMMTTIRFCVEQSSCDGIKISLLHVLKGTDLALDFEKGLVPEISMNEYFELISDAIQIVPKSIVIHRLTGDGPKSLLLSPLWTGNKRFVMNSLTAYFKEHNIKQGSNS